MFDLTLLKDRSWKQDFDNILESYVPGVTREPSTDKWNLFTEDAVYEIKGYVDGALWNVAVEFEPRVEGMFFVFQLNGTTHYISANSVKNLSVTRRPRKTFYKLLSTKVGMMGEKNKVTVQYYQKVMQDNMTSEEFNNVSNKED